MHNSPCFLSLLLLSILLYHTTIHAQSAPDCLHSGAVDAAFRLNIGGPAFPKLLFGADNPSYIGTFSHGVVYNRTTGPLTVRDGDSTSLIPLFTSHRYTTGSALIYRIPVPRGTYSVRLFFAETLHTRPGRRFFDIYINGKLQKPRFDVFKKVGSNKGIILKYTVTTRRLRLLSITLLRVKGDPFLSALTIKGPRAAAYARGAGCPSNVTVPGSGSNQGFDHRAHAKPGGPYFSYDFNSDTTNKIRLDASDSHSHFFEPGPPTVAGTITAFKWTWTEMEGDVPRNKVRYTSRPKVVIPFPFGVTQLKLTVLDMTGDVAEAFTTVNVQTATEKGPYCYFYNLKTRGPGNFPRLNIKLRGVTKPDFGSPYPSINFTSLEDFGPTPFELRSFALQCLFSIRSNHKAIRSLALSHNGAVKLFKGSSLILNTKVPASRNISIRLGTRETQLQLHYYHVNGAETLLKFAIHNDTSTVPTPDITHHLSDVYPIILSLSLSTAPTTGGDLLVIEGSGFMNKPYVRFGTTRASFAEAPNSTKLLVIIPRARSPSIVKVMVVTKSGQSNTMNFTYKDSPPLSQRVQFTEQRLLDSEGKTLALPLVAAVTFGPDGRLYTGSTVGVINALSINRRLRVTSKCTVSLGWKRSILGLAFSPFTNQLKLYFTTSTFKWIAKGIPFEDGWANGKIETIEFSTQFKETNTERGEYCASNRSDLVTGLPVSNLDHALNKLQFLPDGRLIVGIGGFTNGGISIPGVKPFPGAPAPDKMGGVASNPLSAAIVSCPTDRRTDIRYDNLHDPQNATVVSGHSCKTYATGFRNSFGMTYHTNGFLFATDNGANPNFGDFALTCSGQSKPSSKQSDKLFRVEENRYHGHPNLNRGGEECVFYPPTAVQPILGALKSSTTGVMEYRSNVFGGQLKSNLFLSKYAPKLSRGQVSRVKVASDGNVEADGFTERFFPASGLSIIEGGRGEIIMPRVYKKEIVVLVPQYTALKVTFMIGLLPRHGPASGGTRVVITGHEFGNFPTATFGDRPCTDVKLLDNNRFSCITPKGRSGTQVKVIVTGKTGNSPTYGNDFWYF